MLLSEFKSMMVTVDPTVNMYKSDATGDYTVWRPGSRGDGIMSDDEPDEEVTRVYVSRFTRSESDAVAIAIEAALMNAFIPYEHEIDFENETGYIHHTFTCYVG